MKIYVSGLYSGGNPQPGVGIARSLRLGYPEATLVGVEYSNRSSGIHWSDFDDLWLQRPWDELDLGAHGRAVRALLDGGALWISGSDLESMWLAGVFPNGHPNLLTPPGSALARIVKPQVVAHEGLPVSIPPYVGAELADWDLHAFCRKHDWRVWLKGPYYDAVRTRAWDQLETARTALAKVWNTERLFLQAHVSGYEESVMLCAYEGELLHAVSMRKREVTEEGKTWAGDVAEVDAAFLEPLRRIVGDLNWTGGGELEMVRDADGRRWLLEWNPRFPAWVHGATIAGGNLPALLVEGATGVAARPAERATGQFTRVVLEVPVRDAYPLPPLPEPVAGGVGHSLKHPSGLPGLAERLHKLNAVPGETEEAPEPMTPRVPETMAHDLGAQDFARMETPSFILMESTAAEGFRRAAEMAHALSTNTTTVTNAYSIKTNPDPRLIKLALDSGFLAEGISLLELQRALEVGFRCDQLVLNGPGKWWPEGLLPKEPIHAVFCDSAPDLKKTVAALKSGELRSKTVGVRLRTPHVPSRFGIAIDSPKAFRSLVESIAELPTDTGFGVHFHMASSNIGVGAWWRLYDSMLRWCQALERLTGRTIQVLDIGGGWFPDDWHCWDQSDFARAVRRAQAALPNVGQIISEPGKAMAQPSMALAMRVLEMQQDDDGEVTEVVVDGSIAELPMHSFQPHRVMAQDADRSWKPLRRGKSQLLGRLCMEHDVVAANIELPEGTRPGDVLVFCDAGGYDRSMSYVFGRG
ncbi:MAG TPA: ATP-grasp domain-containing protein [Caulobacteraceae bacterium]|jgi:diaminopimelate decarboxylase